MPPTVANPVLADLRTRIERLEHGRARDRATLPFDVSPMDAVLPGGGLALGALHEVAGGGKGAIHGAAAALFAAGIAARTKGKVLWCVGRATLRRITRRIHVGDERLRAKIELAAAGVRRR